MLEHALQQAKGKPMTANVKCFDCFAAQEAEQNPDVQCDTCYWGSWSGKPEHDSGHLQNVDAWVTLEDDEYAGI